MLGAIAGDIAGSRFEWNNLKSKKFELFHPKCFFTDDSLMTIALAKAILDCKGDYALLSEAAVKRMVQLGRMYPYAGYGLSFAKWLETDGSRPYDSFGNGAGMRVSACGFAANSLNDVKDLSLKVTRVTHNHPEGIKGAEATAVCIYLARTGSSIEEIRKFVNGHYYKLDFTLDGIRNSYGFDVSCQGTVPQAIEAFLESTGFEDAIRNAISIGGDSDTLAAITGGIAEAFYGMPNDIRQRTMTYLDDGLRAVVNEFESKFPPKVSGN